VFAACLRILAERGEVLTADPGMPTELEVQEAREFIVGAGGGGDAWLGGEGGEV